MLRETTNQTDKTASMDKPVPRLAKASTTLAALEKPQPTIKHIQAVSRPAG